MAPYKELLIRSSLKGAPYNPLKKVALERLLEVGLEVMEVPLVSSQGLNSSSFLFLHKESPFGFTLVEGCVRVLQL